MARTTDQTRVVCVVLPNKNQVNITVGSKCRGQEVIGQLSELLGIQDLHLFGLCLEKDNDHLFLDLDNKLSTYFPTAWKHNTLQERIALHLKVQYYQGDGRLMEEKARSLYYADLKGRVLCSLCSGQEGQYFQLAAYALQADMGDWREKAGPYFKPHDYFPPWILTKHGCDYVVQHTPALHRELLGMCECDAVLLFIQEACRISDVPVIFYSMSKVRPSRRKKEGASVLVGLALTGLHVYECMVSGEQLLLYEFDWSSIDRINFQGRRFEIRTDGLAGSELVLYTRSVLHSQHLLKHMSSIHRLHLKTKHSVKGLQLSRHRAGGLQYREVCVKETIDSDTDESEGELPPVKFHLAKAKIFQATPVEPVSRTGQASTEIEMCVDEPEEMFVDDPEDIICLTELLEGVSVDGPPLMPVSPWIDITMEMKQMLKMFPVMICLLLCTGHVLQTESCRYRVKLLQENSISCFSKMQKDQCTVGQPGSLCQVEKGQEHTCIKWMSNAELACVNENVIKVPVENASCAIDQESLACTKEFQKPGDTQSRASHGTTFLGGVILLLFHFSVFLFF